MPLDFPPSPTPNQVYSLDGKSWKWNGDAWETYNDNLGVDFVETVNGATGDVGVVGGTDISVSTAGKTLTINYTGSGGGAGTNVVSSFNGRTGAVQGVSSANGLTGSVTFAGGQGITHTVSGNGISFSINYSNGGAAISNASGFKSGDLFLIQRPTSGGAMYTETYGQLYSQVRLGITSSPYDQQISSTYISSASTNRFLMSTSGGNEGGVTFSDVVNTIKENLSVVTSYNGLTGAVQGVSSANGLTGAVVFGGGQGITHIVNGNGISFGINYLRGGAGFSFIANNGGSDLQTGTDLFMFQEKNGVTAPYLISINNFLKLWVPYTKVISSADVQGSNNNRFLMSTSGGNEGGVTFSDVVALISSNMTFIDGGTYA